MQNCQLLLQVFGGVQDKYSFNNQEQAIAVKADSEINHRWWMVHYRLFCKALSQTFSIYFHASQPAAVHREGDQKDSLCCCSAVGK